MNLKFVLLLSQLSFILLLQMFELFEIITKQKTVVTDAVHILLHFNIILLNTTGCALPRKYTRLLLSYFILFGVRGGAVG
jgi:hypothetical protein